MSSADSSAVVGTYSLTFGEVCEHDYKSEKHGVSAEHGFSPDVLREVKTAGVFAPETVEYVHLTDDLASKITPEAPPPSCAAGVVIIHGGVDQLLGEGATGRLLAEQQRIQYSTKGRALFSKKIIEKRARHTTVFSDTPRDSTLRIEDGEVVGSERVLGFVHYPEISRLRDELKAFAYRNLNLAPELNLFGEGNHYYAGRKSGIGFHGDGERKIVICARLGDPLPIVFQWHQGKTPLGGFALATVLKSGDIYIMSEKATGNDWHDRKVKYHLRHAAGGSEYLIPSFFKKESRGTAGAETAKKAAEDLEVRAFGAKAPKRKVLPKKPVVEQKPVVEDDFSQLVTSVHAKVSALGRSKERKDVEQKIKMYKDLYDTLDERTARLLKVIDDAHAKLDIADSCFDQVDKKIEELEDQLDELDEYEDEDEDWKDEENGENSEAAADDVEE